MRLRGALLWGALAAASIARPAAAIEYETVIDVDDEEDLVALLESDQITSETFDALREVLRQGVDLDTATREDVYTLPNLTYAEVDQILAYRAEAGKVGDPQNLVGAGVLSQERLDTIAPFLRAKPGSTPFKYATNGWVRSQNVVEANDVGTPSSALVGRVVTLKHLTAGGAVVLTSNRVNNVVYDPLRDALTADAPSLRPELPKVFARWDEGTWGAIVGSYRIGFGERLTFDDTTRYTPNGFIPDDDIVRGTTLSSSCRESTGELAASPCPTTTYEVPDYRWREGLFGAAVGARAIPAGVGMLQLYGWASTARRPIYQYEIYDKRTCDDPTSDDPGCSAPTVYRTQDDPLAPTSAWKYQTLPDMYLESLAGGNVTWSKGTAHLGVTGYGATVDWLVDGMDLDFQEYSRLPRGGPFGAAGANVGVRLAMADLFAEVTRTFDSTPAGGDLGGIIRATFSAKKQELELSARWYGQDFVNPYARPIASADELGGQRARDEIGGRVRYAGEFQKRFTLRAIWDLWENQSTETPKTNVLVRGDYLFTKRLGAGLWLTFVDKDLSDQGGTQCYETTFETDESGQPIACTGQRQQAAVRVRVMPNKKLTLSAQYQHALLDDEDDDPTTSDAKRQDVAAWLQVMWHPSDRVRVRARTRYYDQDIDDHTTLERSWWSFVELWGRVDRQLAFRTRVDVVQHLDADDRDPNPEVWVWLEGEARF